MLCYFTVCAHWENWAFLVFFVLAVGLLVYWYFNVIHVPKKIVKRGSYTVEDLLHYLYERINKSRSDLDIVDPRSENVVWAKIEMRREPDEDTQVSVKARSSGSGKGLEQIFEGTVDGLQNALMKSPDDGDAYDALLKIAS